MTRLVTLMVSCCCWILLLLLPTSIHANNRNHHKQTKSFSRKLNQQVEDLYVKAEKLQDRAFQRVYELQEQAQRLQDKAFARSQQLEQQSQSILEKATRQAKTLQEEAAHNLGELKSAVEGLPIPFVGGNDDAMLEEASGVEEQAMSDEAEVDLDIGNNLSIEVPLETVEPTTTAVQKVVVKNKWQNVQERTLPAVIMLGGLATYVKLGGSFIPLVFLIQFGLFAETAAVADVRNIKKWWWFLAAVIGTNGQILGWKYADVISYGMSVVGLVAWVIQQNAPLAGPLIFRANLGILAATALSLLVLVGQSSFWIATLQDYGLLWILYPAFLVIINDTMAYVFGMLMGKHPLLPIISPKKTWEGFTGATISTMAVSYPLLQKMMPDVQGDVLMHAMAMSTFISLVSPFGGFLASIVKRAHGKKDFANWIPGHGGVVDRLDCQVVTAPFVYFYLSYIMTNQS